MMPVPEVRKEIKNAMLFASIIFIVLSSPVHASASNHLYRVDIRPKKDYTRISVKLQNPPHYTIVALPGNRLRLIIQDTDGTVFKKFRRYSDPNIGGLLFTQRGENLLTTFQIAVGTGWRDITREGISAITVDVGKTLRPPEPHPSLAGREKIWHGVEKLVRDFDPPLKPEIPFLPTDRQILKNILDGGDQQAFIAAEGSLYKGRLAEAEEVFTRFAAYQTPVKSIALYRLGETCYKLQKYPQALAAFREAEKLWPAYLNHNPGITFYYGDSIARGGDLAAARIMLTGLIGRLAEKKFAPALLIRLGDILSRQGHEQEALALYRTVADNFQMSKANRMALLRLGDRNFLKVNPWSYWGLSKSYLTISRQSGDLDLREEALFKHVLLESLHGDASDALRLVILFQKNFPHGIYASVGRTMREVLVTLVYRETKWANDAPGLIRFAEEQQEYLAGCVEQPEFFSRIARAYEEAGRPMELIRLFTSMLDRQWASSNAPLLYEAIADNADLLGDTAMTEKYLLLFIKKYPSHPHTRMMLERLGGLYYSERKYQESKDTLLWLLNKKERALKAESYYYLGRSLWTLKQLPATLKAMELYISSTVISNEQLLPDAYYVAVSARELLGDRRGALRLLEGGLKATSTSAMRKDALLYKAGELNQRDGRKKIARDFFDQVAKKSTDPEWQKLAQQALDALGGAIAPAYAGNASK